MRVHQKLGPAKEEKEHNTTQTKLSYFLCRYRNGQLLDLTNRSRYDGATVEQPSLVIKSVDRSDSGIYSCVLENDVGASESKSTANVDVICKYIYTVVET